MRERIQLPPIDSWCAPRTRSRSSATCHPLELKYPGFVAPDPTEKPLPVTLTPTYPGTRLETREPRSVALKYAGSGRSFSVRLNVTCSELRVDADSTCLCARTSECPWLFCPVRLGVRTLVQSLVAGLS